MGLVPPHLLSHSSEEWCIGSVPMLKGGLPSNLSIWWVSYDGRNGGRLSVFILYGIVSMLSLFLVWVVAREEYVVSSLGFLLTGTWLFYMGRGSVPMVVFPAWVLLPVILGSVCLWFGSIGAILSLFLSGSFHIILCVYLISLAEDRSTLHLDSSSWVCFGVILGVVALLIFMVLFPTAVFNILYGVAMWFEASGGESGISFLEFLHAFL